METSGRFCSLGSSTTRLIFKLLSYIIQFQNLVMMFTDQYSSEAYIVVLASDLGGTCLKLLSQHRMVQLRAALSSAVLWLELTACTGEKGVWLKSKRRQEPQRRCPDCRRKLGKGLCCQTESGSKEWRLGLGTGGFEESEVMLRTNHITLCWLSGALGDKRKWKTTQGNVV